MRSSFRVRSRIVIAAAGFLLSSISSGRAAGPVRLSEVMYNPPQGEDYEYIEIHNTSPNPVDISGWAFVDGIDYAFPPSTIMPGNGWFVIARSKAAILSAYPSMSDGVLFGDHTSNLKDGGEKITLANSSGGVEDSFTYDDDPPWDFLADGFGASLERLCFTADATLPENWRASPLPAAGAFAGSPGAPNSATACPPVELSRPRVFISEIMYHPVLEESLEDNHEFIEIHNAEAGTVSLAGWRLAGGTDFTFPPGSEIAGGGYRVIARNRAALAAVASYGLQVNDLFGDYSRSLNNGGEKVALIGPQGQGIDSVTYDDKFPWPSAPDALGADEDWLPASVLPLSNHRYRGISLERVSFDYPAGLVYNWAPSPLDGATPGRANASARTDPLPIVIDKAVVPVPGPGPLIRSSDQVQIRARFGPSGGVSGIQLQYFVDDVATTGEAVITLPMVDDGTGGDPQAGDGEYTALLPNLPQNSIVRYRIRADRGSGIEVISPRPSDPFGWFAYFVSPVINTQTRLYQVFISPVNWGKMWTNIASNRVSGCTEVASWNAKVPAVFIHGDGIVVDAQVRYQGSTYNRTNGVNLSSWPYPKPSTGPLVTLSWHIILPSYSQMDGRSEIVLNKLTQGCPGFYAGVGFQLFANADVPAPTTRFIRFHVNGGYYRYMMEYEVPDEAMMNRYHREMAVKHPDWPPEKVGHLFKSEGYNGDQGPWGWGDERVLLASCGYPAYARYQHTYDRHTHGWDTHDELINMLEELNSNRIGGVWDTDSLRTFFADRFDVELLLNYLAIINWGAPFDDMFQNHFLYQRLSDGKWLVMPWDLDLDFGGWLGADASLYMGEEGDPNNRSGWWNYLKDAFLKSYRSEFEDRLVLLNNTILHPTRVGPIVDAVLASSNQTEADQALSPFCGSLAGGAAAFKNFTAARFAVVNQRLSAVEVDAGPDQTTFVGNVVQFDASASRPDPSTKVPYTWSNGMKGEKPTFTFTAPGTFTITLTVTVSGTPYQDSVTITVLPAPDEAFSETGGQVSLEAEHFFLNDRHGAAGSWWEEATTAAGFSGEGYMLARDNGRVTYPTDFATAAPELRYAIKFEDSGTFRVWIRGLSDSTDHDSVHVGIDGAARDESWAQRFVVSTDFQWSGATRSQGSQVLSIARPGLHMLSLWVRESGQTIDKIVLTKDTSFTPTALGPAESPLVSTTPHQPFVRGDANRDGGVDISDPLAILFYLFTGQSALTCADHGDADDNGKLEITDAVYLLRYLFQAGPPPPAPFPAAGFDATVDSETCGNP